MLLSRLARVVVKGPDGKATWREVSQLTLPKGGKVMDTGLKLILVGSGVALVFSYISLQSDINPDSRYARLMRKLKESQEWFSSAMASPSSFKKPDPNAPEPEPEPTTQNNLLRFFK